MSKHGADSLLEAPVTLVLVLGNLAVFSMPGGVPLRDVCLSPFCVIEKKQWARWGSSLLGT